MVMAFWITCLLLPVVQLRVELVVAAVAISGVAIPVMILPELIRMWNEVDPRDHEEMKLVGGSNMQR
jgi:hypothetical protein